ncbi:BlaI/MecI/CopY family transcriptional regulator [Mongoliitalea lutea]|uniref:Transcriptional regulator n=1 Tax=Mongoliitalea lutea TaxID=849756 RepID=A0A8J3CYM8_9BACT|nr:BlaI/MecI/CopY family transcriptional regulator [Mongoliitalea lutea]GHB41082.1 hypothetical protein GCM10008106_22760 [Mongoliitalea lutea]
MDGKPTEAELEILSLLWQMENATVREIHEKLAETKETGYTTTLKIMQIMHSKGMLGRDEANRTHVYYPAVAQEATQKSLIKSFVSAAFAGSSKDLVLQALGQGKPTKEEIDEIRAFLDHMEKSN